MEVLQLLTENDFALDVPRPVLMTKIDEYVPAGLPLYLLEEVLDFRFNYRHKYFIYQEDNFIYSIDDPKPLIHSYRWELLMKFFNKYLKRMTLVRFIDFIKKNITGDNAAYLINILENLDEQPVNETLTATNQLLNASRIVERWLDDLFNYFYNPRYLSQEFNLEHNGEYKLAHIVDLVVLFNSISYRNVISLELDESGKNTAFRFNSDGLRYYDLQAKSIEEINKFFDELLDRIKDYVVTMLNEAAKYGNIEGAVKSINENLQFELESIFMEYPRKLWLEIEGTQEDTSWVNESISTINENEDYDPETVVNTVVDNISKLPWMVIYDIQKALYEKGELVYYFPFDKNEDYVIAQLVEDAELPDADYYYTGHNEVLVEFNGSLQDFYQKFKEDIKVAVVAHIEYFMYEWDIVDIIEEAYQYIRNSHIEDTSWVNESQIIKNKKEVNMVTTRVGKIKIQKGDAVIESKVVTVNKGKPLPKITKADPRQGAKAKSTNKVLQASLATTLENATTKREFMNAGMEALGSALNTRKMLLSLWAVMKEQKPSKELTHTVEGASKVKDKPKTDAPKQRRRLEAPRVKKIEKTVKFSK